MECEICGTKDTERQVRMIKGKCLCSKHITQLYRHGTFLDKTIYSPNEYILHDDYAEIVLRDKHANERARALIDLEDVEMCKQYKWHARKGDHTLYVIASLPDNAKVHLHRLVLHYDGSDDVDHLNHNGLDNRKANLKVKSHAANMRNQGRGRKSIKKTPCGHYRVVLTINYKPVYLGTFNTYEEALEVRERAASEIAS